MSALRPPVLVIGSTRSGTTMLGRLLGAAPDTCFFHEPNTLWRIGHAYRGTDEADAADAKPWVIRRIRHAFERYQAQHDGRVVRVPFVRAILPEAKIVHICRDGRATLRSQIEQYDTFKGYEVGSARGRRHLQERLLQTPWWEWPAYLPRAVSGVTRTYVLRDSIKWFGLRYPGWKRDQATMTTAQLAARQWVVAVESALRDLADLPPDSWIDLRYEQVVSEPRRWFERICTFGGLEPDEAYLDMVEQTVQTASKDRWQQELDETDLEEAMPIMRPLLERLGYTEESH
ncbi:MAG: sulfotransferase family protein [Planctomycetota bacterium]|jgi:hypothetical protein